MAKLMADANFKAIFRNKKVAERFIKLLIPELEKSVQEEVENYSVIGEELDEDKIMTETEAEKYILSDELEYLPDSQPDKQYKETIHDILFNYKSDMIPTRNNIITVDCEMEGYRQNYPITARGMYTAAKLHSQTVEKGKNYKTAHKVYSIWLLNYSNWKDDMAIRSIYQAMTFTPDETVELYGENKRSTGYDRNSDGIEVIYIELPKVDKENIPEKLRNMLLSIRDGNDIIEVVKEICELTDKEANTMQTNVQNLNIKANPYVEMGRLEGRKEGRKEGMQEGVEKGINNMIKVMIELGADTDMIIFKLIDLFDLTEDKAKLYYENFCK